MQYLANALNSKFSIFRALSQMSGFNTKIPLSTTYINITYAVLYTTYLNTKVVKNARPDVHGYEYGIAIYYQYILHWKIKGMYCIFIMHLYMKK